MSDLRERIAETLRSTPRALNAAYWDDPDIDHHAKHESGSTAWCALCCRDVDALVAALVPMIQAEIRAALLAEVAFCRKHADSTTPDEFIRGYVSALSWAADCIEYRANGRACCPAGGGS